MTETKDHLSATSTAGVRPKAAGGLGGGADALAQTMQAAAASVAALGSSMGDSLGMCTSPRKPAPGGGA